MSCGRGRIGLRRRVLLSCTWRLCNKPLPQWHKLVCVACYCRLEEGVQRTCVGSCGARCWVRKTCQLP
ncbi:hypothetical protein BD311DRAFT_744182, partial [Dichomitus squalens]|uniref:Uncharacterized protein n=1 Tax=Dichomitus squalens TaxID=114155 RepID=A0A4Q9QCG5_9APHY